MSRCIGSASADQAVRVLQAVATPIINNSIYDESHGKTPAFASDLRSGCVFLATPQSHFGSGCIFLGSFN
jgi:hypothetical protein